MSIFEYDHEKEMKLYRKAEREVALEEGLKEGREKGLKEGREEARIEALSILVASLRKYLPDVEAVFREVTGYEEYRNCSREQVLKLYKGEK
ncbi:MAG: hypothetical protein IJP31_01340 [Lachnospiraceae bacterium]|nr:hypothetical protein [Lachnospiraceae bacterium]